MGGEPTFVSVDDYQVGGMEHGGARPDQARPRRRTDPPAARSLRAGRAAALRPGQMVSGRAAAALGVLAASGARTASRSGAIHALIARARRDDKRRRRSQAHRFAEALLRASASRPSYVQPAFEDPADRMLKQGELAGQRRSGKSRDRRSGGARAHHAPVRAPSRRSPAGFVLPVQRWTAKADPGWMSEVWRHAARPAYLIPGRFADRLAAAAAVPAPLRSPSSYPHLVPADPMAPRTAARAAREGASGLQPAGPGDKAARLPPDDTVVRASLAPAKPEAADIPVRTALVRSSARDGRLCVFMPPVERLEDYLELLAAVEATAAELGTTGACRRLLCRRPTRALNVIKVTPDPGVIEVNVHPATTWREAVDITRGALRGRPAYPARHRQVHDRRPPHRHRRRQSCRARRR